MLMIAVLGGLADVERDLIRTRPPKLTPAAAERSTAAAGWGCDACGTRQELQCWAGDDFENRIVTDSV